MSQIWARKPVNSADHFAGLSIAESASPNGETDSHVLFTSLGAQLKKVPPSQTLKTLQDGTVQATVLDPSLAPSSDWSKGFSFQVYTTEFQPNVGVFASSSDYWSKQSEATRLVWKQVVDEAGKNSADEIRGFDEMSKNKTTVSVTPPDREEVVRTLTRTTVTTNGVMTTVIHAVPNLSRDLDLVDEAKAFLKVNGANGDKDSLKKK